MLGLDEAGCGPAFGELVASAVCIPETVIIPGLTDSKKLSTKKRDVYYQEIIKKCQWSTGIVSNTEIDEMGLGEARRVVFERALENFESKYPEFIMTKLIVDGTIFRKWKNVHHECIPKADSLYSEVSAASVIAKVTRDKLVTDLCSTYPYLDNFYCISQNKGYLTKKHVQGIKKHGITEFHRKSYNIKL